MSAVDRQDVATVGARVEMQATHGFEEDPAAEDEAETEPTRQPSSSSDVSGAQADKDKETPISLGKSAFLDDATMVNIKMANKADSDDHTPYRNVRFAKHFRGSPQGVSCADVTSRSLQTAGTLETLSTAAPQTPGGASSVVTSDGEEAAMRQAPGQALTRTQLLGLFLGPALMIALRCVEISKEHPMANDALSATSLIGTWWIFEVMPLPITGLLPLVLFPLMKIEHGSDVAKLYFNSISFLFMGSVLVNIAIDKAKLHRRLSLILLMKFGASPPLVLLGFICIAALVSMFCSNAATSLMLIPFATGLLQDYSGTFEGRRFEKGVLLGIAYGCSVGGVATPVGSPTNGVLIGAMSSFFSEAPEISFFKWLAFAIPCTLVMIVAVWLVVYFMFCRGICIEIDRNILARELYSLGPWCRDDVMVMSALLLQVTLWISHPYIVDPWLGERIEDSTVAMMIAIPLFLLPSARRPGQAILQEKDLRELPWGLLLLFGAGFCIAHVFATSGLSKIIGSYIAPMVVLGPYGLSVALFFLCIFLTEFTSNTSTASVLVPIMFSVAQQSRLHPLSLALPVTVACSFAFMLPISTAPNAAVFSTEKVPIGDMAKAGFILNAVAILVVPPVIMLTGNVFDNLSEFPAWAE
eukprot:TRINITY_DN16487_c0_g1_i1.p1 TRINITY_DN16487_c0_g1~~TRINITY_DN16487_c0_g1_i1.p1  ORF type:complete len:661 (-),score=109.84 TRINITY_DN16487_c0_g1_i1:179-2098(-)